jgi:hypothetical protein
MKPENWKIKGLPYAATALILVLACGPAFAQEHGYGHAKHVDYDERGHGHGHDHYAYTDHDRVVMRGWYREHERHLPPGLAKRDRLPPGLERQLVVRGTLPPGLRARIHPCPQELVRELPPPPPDCEHAVVGGHVVLLNRKTFMVMAVFHFEL